MVDYRDEFKNYLRQKGLKFTPERQIILDGVFSFDNHFDIEKLYGRLRKRNKQISRATIYRTFPLLIESGLVKKAVPCQDSTTYEHTYGKRHYGHLVCIRCGKIIEIEENITRRLQDMLCKRYKFKPVEHRFGVKGYCRDCSSKMEE